MGDAPQSPGLDQETAVLESGVPLSQSVIWRLQRDFYARRGLKAWTEDSVPSYITNNPFIAEIYAGIVAAFIDDCMGPARRGSPLTPENPLRVLELGGGTGMFACLFLRKLMPLLQGKHIDPQMVRYCLTDCSEDVRAFWRANTYLAEFEAAGMLDFQLLRAGAESPHFASCGGKAGSAQPRRSPLVVIANYVFDSLPQDAFVIADGQISETLVTATASHHGPLAPLSSLQLAFRNVPVSPDRYPEKSWNDILEHYRSRLPAATVFFPSAALNLLQQLASSSDGRMLVLAADKGFTREEDLALLQGPPHLEFHASGQCFSALVNFDAIARYFLSNGGEAFLPQKRLSSLNICTFLQHLPDDEFATTRKAYQEAANAFGPDDLFALMSWLNARLDEIPLEQALAILRLTRWDTTALLRLFPAIAPKLRNAMAQRYDFLDAVLKTWANRFPISSADNVLAFNCGVILLELRFFAEALPLFLASEQVLGRSAATSYNLGLCALGLGRRAEALAYMVDACNLDPAFEPARNSRLKLEKETVQS